MLHVLVHHDEPPLDPSVNQDKSEVVNADDGGVVSAQEGIGLNVVAR